MTAFDAFGRTFDETYPFFAAEGVDRDAARDRHRPQTDAQTTGIPPHLAGPVFTDDEFEHGRDAAFDRAVRELP